MVFKVIAHRKIWRCFSAIIFLRRIVKLCGSVWSFSGSRLTLIYFIFRSVIPRRPELNIKSIERFSSSCSAEREEIKYSENSAKPEVDFEPNRVEIVFGIFLPKKAVLAETNYGPFLFLLGPTYGQNTREINFSACAIDSRFRSIFIGIHS